MFPGWVARLAASVDQADDAGRAARAVPAAAATPRAHGRPGTHLLLTDEQWENYDGMQRLADRMEARYGVPAELAARMGRGRWGPML